MTRIIIVFILRILMVTKVGMNMTIMAIVFILWILKAMSIGNIMILITMKSILNQHSEKRFGLSINIMKME